MNQETKIVVNPQPDAEMGETPYFWSVLKWGKEGWYNAGCGWSRTPLKAFADATLHYHEMNEGK